MDKFLKNNKTSLLTKYAFNVARTGNVIKATGILARALLFKIPSVKKLGEKFSYSGGKNTRWTADWISDSATINRQIKYDIRAVRERARDLWKNNPLIRAYRKRLISDVIGPDGFKLQMRVKKLDGTPDQKANEEIESAFNEWKKKQFCTMSGTVTFTQVLWLLIEQYKRDGEFIARDYYPDKDDNKFGYSLEIIEPDLLDESYNVIKGNNAIIMGVELGEWKNPLRYHFRQYNPKDEVSGFYSFYSTGNNGERLSIAAEYINHIFDPEHSNQVRGISHLAPVMMQIRQLDGYDEAAVINARIGAMKSMIIKQEKDTEEETGDAEDAEGNIINYASNGEAIYLDPGQDVSNWSPNYPDSQYEPFTKAFYRKLAVALGMSYNAWLSDLESVNFSSMRSGLLTERDQWLVDQSFIIETFLSVIFAKWLKAALMNGAVKLPYSQFERFNKPEFLGRRWQWVDPYKDVQAAVTAVDNGLSTRTRELKKQGYDFDDIVEELKRENQKLKDAGINFGNSQPVDKKLLKDDDDDDENDDREENQLILKDLVTVLRKHGNGHYKKLVEN